MMVTKGRTNWNEKQENLHDYKKPVNLSLDKLIKEITLTFGSVTQLHINQCDKTKMAYRQMNEM